jgi:uncharacterized Zn finger protein (UPF0148 family)
MKSKQLLAAVLIIFVVASLAYMVIKESGTNSDNVSSSGRNIEKGSHIVVYYFHGDVRCPTCHKLETYTKETLDKYFANELASEEIVWKSVNTDLSQNKHFIHDYGLYTKSVVLSMIADSKQLRWENLELIWGKVTNKQDYMEYVQQSILNFMGNSKS